jgi:hypothetical protein
MQHNALHGAEKSDYTKEQDLPNQKASPPQAASGITTSDDSTLSSINTSSDAEQLTDIVTNENDEIVDTEYFDLPFPPPTANRATLSEATAYNDLEPNTLIMDSLQYLAYDS